MTDHRLDRWYLANALTASDFLAVVNDQTTAALQRRKEVLAMPEDSPMLNFDRGVPADPLLKRLLAAPVASCSCGVKSPVIGIHDPSCHYRLLHEAGVRIIALQGQNEGFAVALQNALTNKYQSSNK